MLDSRNCIVSVSGAWDDFAADNGGVELYSVHVKGRSIWEFVTGDATRMWLDAVFQLARLKNVMIERNYRCDSPDLKRFMVMRIFSEQDELIRVEHELLSTELRTLPIYMNYGTDRTKKLHKRCSMCGRLHVNDWIEPKQDVADSSSEILVYYTICEDCKHLNS